MIDVRLRGCLNDMGMSFVHGVHFPVPIYNLFVSLHDTIHRISCQYKQYNRLTPFHSRTKLISTSCKQPRPYAQFKLQ